MWLSSCSTRPAVQPLLLTNPPALPGLAEVHFEVKYLLCGSASSSLVNTAGLPMVSAGSWVAVHYRSHV